MHASGNVEKNENQQGQHSSNEIFEKKIGKFTQND